MSASILAAVVCLIACEGAPADHFATYAEALKERGYEVHIHATGPALKKFQERDVEVKSSFSLEDLTPEDENRLAEEIAKTCSAASIVITSLGHVFDIKLQQALDALPTNVPHFAYYENPESFVPGGFSTTAAAVIEVADGIFFANENLASSKIYSAPGKEIDFANKKRMGIGYYPVSKAEELSARRKKDHDAMREAFLIKNRIADKGQKILVYFGGNNEVYFSKAFPAFLQIAAQANLKNHVLVIQQHPGAKTKNQDGLQVEAWLKALGKKANMPKVILSDFSSDEAQVLADAALYYQTSMGPQLVLEGLPTIQIGHEPYEDILVRNGFAPAVTTPEDFAKAVQTVDQPKGTLQRDHILSNLGIREDWAVALTAAIEECINLQN